MIQPPPSGVGACHGDYVGDPSIARVSPDSAAGRSA
jgi:hypothetical protein